MAFSAGEKLILSMLSELHKPVDTREINPDVVRDAVFNDHEWTLAWEYPWLYHDGEIQTPGYVGEVCDILDMWTAIEHAYAELDEEGKSSLAEGVKYYGKNPQFPGFDGNNEGDYLHTVNVLIKMGRWTNFADRDLNSHMTLLDQYRLMLIEYKKRREPRLVTMESLDVEDIAAILNARLPKE